MAERAEIAAIRNEAQQMGVTLRSIFEDWKRARPVFKTVTLEQAIAELKVVQKTNGARDATVKEQIRYLTSFAKGREEIPLSHIRADDIQDWFDARQEPPTNRDRRERMVALLSTLLVEADYYAAGSKLTLKAEDAANAMNQALDYLIQNTFPKMGLLKRLNSDPQREIQAVLRSNDIAQQTLAVQTEEANTTSRSRTPCGWRSWAG